MELTDAYRRGRSLTSLLCIIALAWSAAQIDLKSVSLAIAGVVDLSNATVPLVFACAIIFAFARNTLEFAMQAEAIRRWALAQLDYKLTLYLVRFTILTLAAAGLYRSVTTVAYIALGVILLLIGTAAVFLIGFVVLTPILIRLRIPKGMYSPVPAIAEAEAWSLLITFVSNIAILIYLDVAAFTYAPLQALWVSPPSVLAVTVFISTAICVVTSIYIQHSLYKKLFALQPRYTLTHLPNGRIGVTFHDNAEKPISEGPGPERIGEPGQEETGP